MIAIDKLQFRYPGGEFQMKVPQWRINAGAATALVGPSGCGKTTLLNLVAGILVPQSGSVQVGNTQVSALDARARREFRITEVGMVFQEFELLDYLSVLDNILLPCRISPRLPLSDDLRSRATDLARQVGLADKLHRYPGHLSQGERQRVAVCRALLTGPKLLLCDEPTGNLDPDNSRHILDILLEYVRRTGAALLAVTHDHGTLDRFDETIDVNQFQGASESSR